MGQSSGVSDSAADVAACVSKLQNGTERGWVLKGVDEINLLLEDMGLNLQSMMASPHVRPFAEDVRNWEQRLSLIGEAIEVGSSSAHVHVSVVFCSACKAFLQQTLDCSGCHTHHIKMQHLLQLVL